ncbi:MAG: histidine phosphatase family protein [Porticoccus sp.]
MRIYLLRHGDAPFDASCGERSLSVQGEINTRHVVEQHRRELSQLQLILCSPTLRARQTLKTLIEALGYRGELLFEDALRSEGQLNAVEHCIDALDIDQVLLLSHQPLIGQILEYLMDKSGIGWSMDTSSLACLDTIAFSRGCADMKWLTHP